MIPDTSLKIIFFGSSNYALPVLDILNKNYNLIFIVTAADKPVGREKIVTAFGPKKFAQENNLPVITPRNKDELLLSRERIVHLKPDLAVVADYGLIIPKEIFEIPKYKTLNIHFSKLPKLRGASPVQYTILLGEKSAWLTIFIIDEGLDSGDIIWQKEVKLKGNETTELLKQKLFKIVSLDLDKVIIEYTKGKLKPQKQDHNKATYTRLLKREDGYIPLNLLNLVIKGITPSKQELKEWPLFENIFSRITNYELRITDLIERVSYAFSSWPGLFTYLTISTDRHQKLNGQIAKKRLKILKCHLEKKTENRKQIKKLVLDQVQLEGKKAVTWKQFKEGYPKFNF